MPLPTLDVFQVIADKNRREILHLLTKESLTINHLADNFPISRPAVSKHIKILQEAGFISIRDQGRERYCTIQKEGFDRLREWIQYFDSFWAAKFAKLESILNNTKNNQHGK